MSNEHPRRGGSYTVQQLDAEVSGHQAAANKIAREANPHGAGSDLAKFWDRGHCRLTGVDPSAPAEVVKADEKQPDPKQGDSKK